MSKYPSAITKVVLDEATFHNQSFEPTYINFLFGNNGSGKSTIAKVIKEKSPSKLVWEAGRTSDDFTLLVYNEEFIKRNIASYGGMPGVFTIGEENEAIQRQIEDATGQLGIAQTAFTQASTKLGEQEGLMKKLYDTFKTICWDKTTDFRTAVAVALDGKKTKDGFAKALLAETNPTNYDEASLIAMCEAAFNSDATTYPEMFFGDSTTLEISPLLSKKIVSSGDSTFATFMKAINATNWVRQGHEELHASAGDKCPYCQRVYEPGFKDALEADIAQCFDAQYESDLAALRSYKANYGVAANNMWKAYAANSKNAYPKIAESLKAYNALFETFKAKMQINAQRLDDKIANPDTAVELEDLSDIIAQLNDMLTAMNKQIQENNAIVNDRHKKQPLCKQQVMQYLAFVLSDEVDKYRKSRSDLQKEIDKLTEEKDTADKKVRSLRSTISKLRRQVVNTDAAVEGINALLKDTGFQGFFIREKEDIPNVYEVIRTETGKVAENLSEGERNFIAFLYFHQLVLGSEDADSVAKDKIVVIDDPVSSMDSSALFVVGALVRDMIAICNPDFTIKEHSQDSIKQMFILTHNAFFHQEVTYNQVQHYQYVSFFEITKVDNRSAVTPCIQRNRETPAVIENRNPVQNSYAALWDTYMEVSSSNTLVNVIRQILDYYFLQLCGYSGVSIKDEILKRHRDAFVTKLSDGTEDCSELHMAASLLQYLCTSNDRISDGLNFIHTSIDVDSCRRIFEKIFRHTGQGQHFDMMMKRQKPLPV